VRWIVVTLAACSFEPPEPGSAPDAAMTASVIEWVGDLELSRDGYALPLDKVLRGPVEVCAQTYPVGAAVRVRLGEVAMVHVRDDAGPFGHNALWCATLELAADTTLAVIAEDAAGSPVRSELAVVVREDIALFESAADAASWRMAGRGAFVPDGDTLRAEPGDGLGLYWVAIPTPADFELSAEVRLDRFDDNSGLFIRFRDPETFGYDNTAWVGVHDGLEIQIDETARPDGADVHRTGAVYEQPSSFVRAPDGVPGTWRRFDVGVRGDRVVVRIDGAIVTDLVYPGDPARPDRAKPSRPGAPRFVGLQSHTGRVAFRTIRLRAL
jgi:hypothetical protein